MTESIPTPEDFLGNVEPPIWAEVERYAKNNDEFSAALLSIRARVERLEANSKPTPNSGQVRSSDITPPQWLMDAWQARIESMGSNIPEILLEVAQWGAAWGADQELEACLGEVSFLNSKALADRVRAARRLQTPNTTE